MILHGSEERQEEFHLEICPENKRDAYTLITLIKKHVAPGAVIMIDEWRAYSQVNQEGFLHLTVNQSDRTNPFINQLTWAYAQKIESQWKPQREVLSRGGVQQKYFADYLCEYFWRSY